MQSQNKKQIQDSYIKDARRGGTAPDGMQRAMNAQKINLSKNPYGIISGKDSQNDSGQGIKISSKNSDKSNGGGNYSNNGG